MTLSLSHFKWQVLIKFWGRLGYPECAVDLYSPPFWSVMQPFSEIRGRSNHFLLLLPPHSPSRALSFTDKLGLDKSARCLAKRLKKLQKSTSILLFTTTRTVIPLWEWKVDYAQKSESSMVEWWRSTSLVIQKYICKNSPSHPNHTSTSLKSKLRPLFPTPNSCFWPLPVVLLSTKASCISVSAEGHQHLFPPLTSSPRHKDSRSLKSSCFSHAAPPPSPKPTRFCKAIHDSAKQSRHPHFSCCYVDPSFSFPSCSNKLCLPSQL